MVKTPMQVYFPLKKNQGIFPLKQGDKQYNTRAL